MCSTVWTSSAPLPPLVSIMEVASTDSHLIPDETPQRVGRQNIQMLAVETPNTSQIKAVEHKYLRTVEEFLEWGKHRPLVSDGAQLYSWHRGDRQRCAVHVVRKVEDYAMDNGLDSDEYIRYKLVTETYHEAKEAAAQITEAAGGPMKSACDLDMVKRAGLSDVVKEEAARLRDKIDMAADIIDDGAAVTLNNAQDRLFVALGYPGMPLHTNGVENSIRHNIVAPYRRGKGPFPNWTAARNFSIQQTFAATCRKNGVSVYDATVQMARDPDWNIFTRGIPPPIMPGIQ